MVDHDDGDADEEEGDNKGEVAVTISFKILAVTMRFWWIRKYADVLPTLPAFDDNCDEDDDSIDYHDDDDDDHGQETRRCLANLTCFSHEWRLTG